MARLPQPGSDSGTWGNVLNDFLVQSHASDGTLKPSVVTTNTIASATITEAKLDPAVVTKLNNPAGVADATPSAKGIVQLAGDLGGTAASPTVPGLAGKAPTASPIFTGTVTTPAIAVTGGLPAVGKILTSDISGNASWQTPVTSSDLPVLRFLGRNDPRPNPLLSSSFERLPDGAMPGTFDTGQTTQEFEFSGTTRSCTVTDGKLAGAGTGAGATYLKTPDLGATITRIGSRFVFSPGTATRTGGGTAAIAITTQSIDASNAPTTLGMSCHFWVTASTWAYTVWEPGTGQVILLNGSFAVPLTVDGVTEYEFQAWLSGNTATFDLPDGTRHSVTDTRIGQYAGQYAFFESYLPNGNTDDLAGFSHVWADTGTARPTPTPAVAVIPPVVTATTATSTINVNCPDGAVTAMPLEMALTVTVPASGKLIFDLSSYIQTDSGVSALFFYFDFSTLGGTGAAYKTDEIVGTKQRVAMGVATGLTPGMTAAIRPNILVYGAAATVIIDVSQGFNSSWSVTTAA